MKKIKEFFQDESGMFSMGRLITFFIFIISCFILLWSLFNKTIPDNSDIIKWLFGFSIGGKVIQSFAENIKSPK